ncbi:MAG: InlB B-repeat-containing protein [Clostridia bacterium]|nr:InlB B-repeat-containing protein [Clostridia bacterium]
MSFLRFDNGKKPNVETANADTPTYATLNDNYAAFANGATYSYTDHAKAEEFEDSAEGIGTDTTTVTIDRAATHGTKLNPYVIDSYAKWNIFASANGITHDTDNSFVYDYGKVFVLAIDIDFRNQAFTPIWAFSGEFYGLGHTLSNITFNYNSYNPNHPDNAMGVFCWTYSGRDSSKQSPTVIADLNVDNYSFTNAPENTGAILGRADTPNTYIMNCHAKGTMDRSTATGASACWGGIVGSSYCDTAPNVAGWYTRVIWTYRCSADLTVTITDVNCIGGNGFFLGGMCGELWCAASGYFYNCYAVINATTKGGGVPGCGIAVGLMPSNANNGTGGALEVRECVGKINWNWLGGGTAGAIVDWTLTSSVFSIYPNGDPDDRKSVWTSTPGSVKVQNVYTSGNLNYSDGSTNVSNYLPPWLGIADDAHKKLNNFSTFSLTNVNYSHSGTATAMPYTVWNCYTESNGTEYVSTENNLWNSAKGATVLKKKIWENYNNIGGTYSIANSPVKNKKINPVYKVEYYNLKMNGSEIIDDAITGVNNTTYEYGKMTSLTLAGVANPTGRQFKGWTTDITGNSEPIKSVNMTGMNGNLKFYAVWDVTDVTATISTLNNVTTAVSGGDSIYLQATITTPTITNPEITYKFLKDGTVVSTATGAANNQYVVDTIAKSGDYSLDYSVYDKQYPLMRHSGTGSTATGASSLTLTITKKLTTKKRFILNSTATPAYVGRPLEGLQFQLTMVDANTDTEVPGTAVWEVPNSTVKSGTNKANLVFTPTDSATYETIKVEVEFESVDLMLNFHIDEMPTFDFAVKIDYGQAYSASQIVDMFENGYNAAIAKDSAFEESVNNRTPQLNGVDINKYSAAFNGATEPQTINITFTDPKPYDAFLDYDFENKKENKKIYWNKFIPAPTTPNRGEDWKLVGWFVTKDGEMTETQWDFASDRVTENVSLKAKWVQIVITLESVSVSARSTTFTALTALDKLGLTVTATYSSTDSDEPITKTIPFKTGNSDGYEVRIDGAPANELHFGDETIEIWYDGELRETLDITVNPVKLNSSSINFPACTKDYIADTPQNIDPLTINSLPAGIREHVLNIDISYFSDRNCTQPVEEVIEQGTYYARATFIMKDDDHELAPVTTRFIISPPRQVVTISWNLPSTNYVYTGLPQVPTAVLTAERDGVLSASQFEYLILDSNNAVSEGKDADTYTVSVVFAESVESVYKFAQSAVVSVRYTIDKAKVNKPVANITSFEYSGEAKNFVLNLESYMSYSSDSKLSATEVGTYWVTVQLDKNHEWTEGGSTERYGWTITKKTIARPTFGDVSIEYNSLEQSIVGELSGFNEETMVIAGEKGKNAGSYTARVTPSSNYTWDNESTPVSVSWTITKRTLYIIWEDEDTYEKDGTKRFSPKIIGFDGLAPEDKFNPDTDASSVKYSGDTNKSAVGAYVVKFSSLTTSWASNYEIEEDLGKGYRIIAAGADPDDPNNPQVPDPANPNGSTENNGNGGKGGTTGENPSDGTVISYLPIILSGVSLILIVVFTLMTLNYNSAAKNAMAKTKQLAQVSYSFAPAGFLAVALGLSVSNWWIIAGVLMGLALIMGIVAFTFRGKKQKALILLAEEEKRVAEEKEFARREEEKREMRMMFASMQQNYQQPQFNYEALQGAIASSVSALLPALQQQMALPPAAFDVNASLSADAQKEIDGLHAQMAQQQELLNRILENQQSYVMPLYEEEVQDDTSWLGENEEFISLEESYGALSDEGRRFYYEIGSYIMNKPRTSQNDGRYAVLFKYRGKTIFKLCIKDDAPVLYYPAGGGRSEIRVSDVSSLELAKSVIDRQTVKVDNEF